MRRLETLVARYVILVIVVSAAILTAFYEWRHLESSDERADALRLQAAQLLAAQIDQETSTRGYQLTADRRFLEPYTRAKALLDGSLNRLLSQLRPQSAEYATLRRFAVLHQRWEREVAQPVLRNPLQNRTNIALHMHGKTLTDAMRAQMATLDALAAALVADNSNRTHAVQYLEAVAIIAVILAMGIYAMVYERSALATQERAFEAIAETSHTATRIGEWRMKVIAMLAHDFKSALAVISACASVLEEFPEKREDPGPYRGIHEAVDQLSVMTDEALLMARIASDMLPIKRERVALAPVLESIASRYSELHPIHVYVRDEAVVGDEAYLLRAFDNIVSNATKYSAPTQPVDLDVRRDGTYVEIACRDQGEGIDPADLPHVFQEYWRSPHTTGATGVGLGLFIVKKIVDAHGGTIDLMSVPGAGTTVYVRLPAA